VFTFSNCVITNNEAGTTSAGAAGASIENSSTTTAVKFINCTVANNKMLNNNGAAGINYKTIPADITNCVFWGNDGATPYHVKVNTALTTNKMLNCAFDNRFVESEVSPSGFATDLTGKVIVDVNNTGSTASTLYSNFVSPTNFVGKTGTTGDITSLSTANWSITSASAFLNAGTSSTASTDFTGLARPQGGAFDIGAYEYPYYNTTVTFNTNGTVDSYVSGAVVSDANGKQLSFTITANSLYKITSVLYNNVEVKGDMVGAVYTAPALSANASLVVQFDLATGLDKTLVDLKCFSADNSIELRGLTAGQEVIVYNITGVIIATKTASTSSASLVLPRGIYMVKVANSVKKVIVK
jgi:hypothetical protein